MGGQTSAKRYTACTWADPGKVEVRMHRILIVEDESPLRRSLARFLELRGYQVVQAASVAEAEGSLDIERFEAALKTPEVVGEWAEPDENECEDLMGAGYDAYYKITGREFPDGAIKRNVAYPPKPIGEPWEEDQLEELYPSLCEKFY